MVCLQRFLTALLIIPAAIADTSTGTDFIIHAKKFTGGAWSGRDFFDLLKEVLQPTLELIAPIIDFVVKNPWVLSPLLIPAMNLWLTMIGFEAGGIVAGSLAAAIQASIGNVPLGSIFAFLQSYGAGGFAKKAMDMAGGGLLVAVVLATLGKILIEQGIEREDVAVFLEKVWNGTGETFGVPTGGPGGAGEAVMGMLGSARGAWDAVFAGL